MVVEKSMEELLEKGYETRNTTLLSIDYGEITSQEFGTVKLSTTLPCFLPPEYYPEHNPELIAVVVEKVVGYFNNFNVTPKSSLALLKFKGLITDSAQMAYFLFPVEKFQGEVGLLFVVMTVIAFSFDDNLEESNGFGDIGPTRAMNVIDLLGRYLRGDESVSMEGMDQYPQFLPLQNAAQASMARCREVCPRFAEDQEHFIQAMSDDLMGMTILQIAEDNPSSKYTETVQNAIRIQDGAAISLLEIFALLLEIQAPLEIRRTFFFREAVRNLAGFVAAANDLISLGQDLKDEWASNPIIKRSREKSISLEESFEIESQNTREYINSLFCIGKTLRVLYPDSEELDQFLLLMGKVADTMGHLLRYSTRYAESNMKTIESNV